MNRDIARDHCNAFRQRPSIGLLAAHSTICWYISETFSWNNNRKQILFDTKSSMHNINELLVAIVTVYKSSSIKDYSFNEYAWGI